MQDFYTFRAELSERTEHTTTVQVETEQVVDGDVVVASFEVDDSEPLDVFGLIFSRILDELGIVLDDPADFDWVEIPGEDNVFAVTIRRSNIKEL